MASFRKREVCRLSYGRPFPHDKWPAVPLRKEEKEHTMSTLTPSNNAQGGERGPEPAFEVILGPLAAGDHVPKYHSNILRDFLSHLAEDTSWIGLDFDGVKIEARGGL